jgi:tetratricopeptide (TPR) repeat protein
LLAVSLLAAAGAGAQTLEQAEALWRSHDYKGASKTFDALTKRDPSNATYKVRWGRLFLERFNRTDSSALFKEALAIDPNNAGALLGLALVAASSYDASAADLAHRALKADPKLTEAEELLGRLALEDNNPTLAREESEKALKLDARALQAESILASADLLEHVSADAWLNRIASEHAGDGRGYETIGYFLQLNRRYEDGIAYFRKAIAAEPDLWSAHSQLGLNLMRLGLETEARKELELCYSNNWRNDETVNTLRLMDSYKNFRTFKTGTTILRMDKKEADVLRLYMEPELERAIATYQKKYEYKLARPVQLEVYPNHEDFAVRTMGMPGLGALGVTFQDVVAMDSPSGRVPGEFHWAATMWHELSHVYILSITGQRTPRWFTEGLAVHEESQAAPDWGDRLTPEVIKVIKDKKLLPVAGLDRGFIHPSYSGQVVVSYFQAGKICDFISKQWGEHKLLEMAHAFAHTDSTVEVIQKQLGLTPEQFDVKFLAWLGAETKTPVDGFDEWHKDMNALTKAAGAHKYDDVIATGKSARDLYPEYAELYELLAQAYHAKGDAASEETQLLKYSELGGRDPKPLKDLAAMLLKQGKTKESSQVLERLIYIAPLDEELHTLLGGEYLTLNNAPGAIREYRALVLGKSPDEAAAHYGLARALVEAHEPKQAKDELLESLEAAPGFKPAQKMLLQMTETPHTD